MKQTGKIELAQGAHVPNKRGLWFTANEKLIEAQNGIQLMKKAEDRVLYESGWIKFIESLEESWSSFFDEGKKLFNSFQPWAGAIDKQRKSDQLMLYLIQARHQSQHGNICIEWEEGKIQIAPNYYGHIRDLTIYVDGTFEVEANPLGAIHNVITLKHETGRPTLPIIENKKFKQIFNPPNNHLGKNIVNLSPHEIAPIAIDYYKSIYREAYHKFSENKA